MDTFVTVYQDADYEGASQDLSEGSYNIDDLELGNDQLSSLKIPAGFQVTLYEHANFEGQSITFTEDTPWVGDDFNDITSGIVVERIG